MNNVLPRRDFLAGTVAAATASLTAVAAEEGRPVPQQEYYELRQYRCVSAEKQKVVVQYLETALLPALNRQKLDRIGIFTPEAADNFAVYVLIPYRSLDQLGGVNDALLHDEVYRAAASEYLETPKDDPAWERVESRLMKAFSGMPVIEQPAYSKDRTARLFELRIYESHSEEKARLKVEMFNEGEIDIMRRLKMAPLFYGETLISSDVPNLTYMLSAENADAHKQHWDAFRSDSEWDKMKRLERYKDTVSRIVSVTLLPTPQSQL